MEIGSDIENVINKLNNIVHNLDLLEFLRLNKDKCITTEEFINLIYNNDVVYEYFSELEQDQYFILRVNVVKWLKFNISSIKLPEIYEHIDPSHEIKDSFIEEIKKIGKNKNGVYSFWSEYDEPLYIGMSHNIRNRILTSYRERFDIYNREKIYLKYLITQTKNDANVVEIYYINKYRPKLNINFSDSYMTVKVSGIPKFSEPILCNNKYDVVKKKIVSKEEYNRLKTQRLKQ